MLSAYMLLMAYCFCIAGPAVVVLVVQHLGLASAYSVCLIEFAYDGTVVEAVVETAVGSCSAGVAYALIGRGS